MEKNLNHDGQSVAESVNATNMVASVEPQNFALYVMLKNSSCEVITNDDGNVDFAYMTKEESGQIRKYLKKLGYKVVDSYEHPDDDDVHVLETNMPVGEYEKFENYFMKFDKKVYDYARKRIEGQLADAVDGDGKCLIKFIEFKEVMSLIKDVIGENGKLDFFEYRDIRDYMYDHVDTIQVGAYTECISDFAKKLDIYWEYDEVKAFDVTFDKSRKFSD